MALDVNTNVTEERIDGGGGLKIFVRSWRPASAPRAVVVICHGVNSHGGQYLWSLERLAAAGFAAYAPGELGLVVCESFAFQVPAPDLVLTIVKGVSRFAPRLPVLKLKNEDFSRDPKAVKALNDDPLTANEVQPAITVAALVRGNERLRKEFSSITLPVLILHGTVDKATKPAGSQLFYDTAAPKDKTLKLYEGHYHDLLNDLGKETVMQDIKGWIDRHLS
jgi:acylglycerol lipase